MNNCFFATDLHGNISKYEKLFKAILLEKPKLVLLGGDLLPAGIFKFSSIDFSHSDFVNDFLVKNFLKIKNELGEEYPEVMLILGNDDPKIEEASFIAASRLGVWKYVNERCIHFEDHIIVGYSFIPPSPFQLKDWEKYDVSRFIDPGCISPEEGARTITVSKYEMQYSTIFNDLNRILSKWKDEKFIFLFHTPPYKTSLDRAALDGKTFDYVPLDVHIGSIGIQRIIKKYKPKLSFHGHVHESFELTGEWNCMINESICINGANTNEKLCLIKFDLEKPDTAVRLEL